MASPICALSICCSLYVRNSKPTMSSLASCSCSSSSNSLHLALKLPNFTLSSRFSQMGLCHFASWNGLRQMGISISPSPQKIVVGRRDRCKGKFVHASLFGVGAPEALVIGAVALLVFGPKGLAEVARNLGKTLCAFQPTIKELQEVSREFKNTLEREVRLDDDLSSMSDTYGSNKANTSNQSSSGKEKSQTTPVADPNINPPNGAISSEDQLKITGEQPEASASAKQDVASSPPPAASQVEEESQPQVAIQETAIAAPPAQKPETET